jgi:hypothetical protein
MFFHLIHTTLNKYYFSNSFKYIHNVLFLFFYIMLFYFSIKIYIYDIIHLNFTFFPLILIISFFVFFKSYLFSSFVRYSILLFLQQKNWNRIYKYVIIYVYLFIYNLCNIDVFFLFILYIIYCFSIHRIEWTSKTELKNQIAILDDKRQYNVF